MIKITGTVENTINVGTEELGYAIIQHIYSEYGLENSGLEMNLVDLFTDSENRTYYGDHLIHESAKVATLVDAANVLIYGQLLKFYPQTGGENEL